MPPNASDTEESFLTTSDGLPVHVPAGPGYKLHRSVIDATGGLIWAQPELILAWCITPDSSITPVALGMAGDGSIIECPGGHCWRAGSRYSNLAAAKAAA
jgi:hypothetical protein